MPARMHVCRWPGCSQSVSTKWWGCKSHWFMLPAYLRKRIYLTTAPGQACGERSPAEFAEADRAAQNWITKQQAIAR